MDFIREHIYQGKPMDVCEIGCGNGKLLLSMEQKNMLSYAVGYEVSKARCKFADRFLNRYGSKKVQIINDNFLNDHENVVDEKIFIQRDSMKEEVFKSIIRSYTREESIELLNRYGMDAEIYPYYDNVNSSIGRPSEHDLYRVLARKQGR